MRWISEDLVRVAFWTTDGAEGLIFKAGFERVLPHGVPLTPYVLTCRRWSSFKAICPSVDSFDHCFTARKLCSSRGWTPTSAMSRTSTSPRSASTKPLSSHPPRSCSRQRALGFDIMKAVNIMPSFDSVKAQNTFGASFSGGAPAPRRRVSASAGFAEDFGVWASTRSSLLMTRPMSSQRYTVYNLKPKRKRQCRLDTSLPSLAGRS